MSQPVRRQIKLGDGAISILEWERGKPALHFAHANGFNAETYGDLLAPLATQFHIFASDARGHGFTSLPATPGVVRNWRAYRDDLARLLDRLGAAPFILAGHSMGSIASLMVAAAHPDRVKALVLIEPVLVPAAAIFPRALARLRGRSSSQPDLAQRAARRRDVFPSFDAALSAYRGRGAFKTWPEETLRGYLHGGLVATGNGPEMRLSCTPAWESASFRATPHGASRLARKVRCPMTVLYADDGTARKSEIAIIARGKPDARLVHVPGATHFLPMEHPEIVRHEVERIAALVR